ncbi:efflux RND transporter permease subunit [Desulfosporosinus sp. BICA1-9]|uniref:efflux RND transporter permease subunit n=1 Tax=Desulfosporosinus sp. BICA1-9 TaxID=1531958 RepID=UPI00054C6F34|nr:efflux RND transporter permease subunit [Desulfosporosinus sp. BICA1-9]KJS47801.1 MAG: multidrug ABC transporter [Peptococcaceae bacterium BRH_c23]KJS89915.1 MAG: multidrug ABC transporter [Desulfosporosinus sp. BICA1-9]HBW35090.1 AcrB/AcrD/AcrF family protein [Desulfosporosinus sp.]
MKLAEVSVKRPVTIIMTMLIIILLGGISLTRLPIDLMPNIEIPVSIVVTQYSGVGPQEIEKLITNPLEGAISTVGNIDTVTSTTSEGSSVVIAQFKTGTDMDFATLQMREKVDQIKSRLPSEAGAPMVMKLDLGAIPVVILTLSGHDADLAKLQSVAEDKLKPQLERVSGAASVSVIGGYEDQIEIKTHLEKMNGYGLTINSLAQLIRAENLNAPGGQVQKGTHELTIRTTGEFESVDEIKDLMISLPGGGQIRLKDIAEVGLGHKDVNAITKANGEKSVSIAIQKQSGTNTVKVADGVKAAVDEFTKEYPDLQIKTVMDQSNDIKQSIETVKNEAIMGGILAVFVVFLFFHNIRTTFITATAIPIAMMATFAVLYFAGITINMMTLGGLTLAMGRLVDDNIVALENIHRHRKEGYSKIDAAIKGVSEVGMAVFASTLTTVAVFLPIVFVQGIVATIFRELAMTFAISLLASLLVSLTLVPTLSAKLMKTEVIPEGRTGVKGLVDRFSRGFDRIFGRVEATYKRFLHYALHHRKTVMAIATAVFILSSASAFSLGAEFMPASDVGQLTINTTLPDGAKLQDTEATVNQIEKKLETIPEIETVFTQIGTNGGFSLGGDTANTSSISVQLVALAARQRGVEQVGDEIRSLTKDIPGAEIKVTITDNMQMGGSTTPIDIALKGEELDELKTIGMEIQKIVASVEGTREVKSSMTEGVPEVVVKVNRQTAAQYGLSAAQISQAVKGTISGTTATTYRYEGSEIDVVLSGDETFKTSLENLGQTPVPTLSGITVPLSQVAEIEMGRGPVKIERTGQTRVVHVTSQIINRDLRSITMDIETKIKEYQIPDGYTYEVLGENKELMESFADLGLALILAILLVYMILAAQFESLLHPFTIILSLPMGFSGGMLGLFITRTTLSVPSFIGLILLVGIAVSNAIVLVDYIIKRRERGEEREEAIENAGPIRLRPILMTTLATILGLMPMALGIGEGSESMAPMAVVVIFGLALSTMSTLLLVPVIYTIFEDIRDSRKRKKEKQLTKSTITHSV